MKRILSVLLLALLVGAVVPSITVAHAQDAPQVSISSQYVLNRYGFAVVSEVVTVKNNGSSPMQWPGQGGLGIGLGNLTSHVVSANVTNGYQWSNSSSGGTITVTGGVQLTAGNSTTFTLSMLLNGLVSQAENGSLMITVLTSPYVSVGVRSLSDVIRMPSSTQLVSKPAGFTQSNVGSNASYTRVLENVSAPAATTLTYAIAKNSLQDFHPLDVFSATRVISVGPDGNPQVQDTIVLKNLGTAPISTLYIAPLTSSSGKVTLVPGSEPPLLNPQTVTLLNDGIVLSTSQAVQGGANFTIVYQYPLSRGYYSTSGGTVSLRIPLAPPITAFVRSYAIEVSLPTGVNVAQGSSSGITLKNEGPFKGGTFTTAYSLSVGWALDKGVPIASVLFVLLLLGLFVSRTTTTEEEETEEETATDRASAMIQAFEDKTSLINQILSEIPNTDPNDRNKAYFDELRGRLDSYRSRALQRLNEVKQKSTTQKFFDLLNRLHTTEREVDRAAKDTLNLYEQFYTNRMRKEVFDRLLPSYRKRLEKALDQLSEELHVAQREAKLL